MMKQWIGAASARGEAAEIQMWAKMQNEAIFRNYIYDVYVTGTSRRIAGWKDPPMERSSAGLDDRR